MKSALCSVLLFLVPATLVAQNSDDVVEDAALRAALNDLQAEDAAVRRHAAGQLGRLADRGATLPLLALLRDPQAHVRRAAVQSLATLRDPRSLQPLIASLGDKEPSVRCHAVHALGELRDPRATEAILVCMTQSDATVRFVAASALRDIGGEQLIGPVVDMIAQTEMNVTLLASILRNVDRPPVIAYLAKALNNDSPEARLRLTTVLGSLRDRRANAILLGLLIDESALVRKRTVSFVLEPDEGELSRLRQLARQDPDREVRRAANEAWARLSRDDDLLAHWDFEDVVGGVVPDATGNGNDGVAKGCETESGKVGKALRVGPRQFVELDRPPEIPVGGTPFTVTAWVKTQKSDGVVVARGGAYCGFSLYIKERMPRFGIHREQEGPGYIASGAPIEVNVWVHLAGVVKNDRIELYINGRLAATTKTAGYLPGDCGQGMEIGFDVGNSAAEIVTPLVGLVDEVKVFRVALAADGLAAEVARKE